MVPVFTESDFIVVQELVFQERVAGQGRNYADGKKLGEGRERQMDRRPCLADHRKNLSLSDNRIQICGYRG